MDRQTKLEMRPTDRCSDLPPAQLQKLLSLEIKENGQNLSAGQRQMVAIARAVLRSSKMVVLDEATAAVDASTDEALQKAIRRCFTGASSLTIAHRLQTIIDCERVLVLADGQIAEFDSPKVLREKEHGVFRSMLDEALTSPFPRLAGYYRSRPDGFCDVFCTRNETCSNFGDCTERGECQCDLWYFGGSCDCTCNSRGICVHGACRCDVRWDGDFCETPGINISAALDECTNCSARGICVEDDDDGFVCECLATFYGDNCERTCSDCLADNTMSAAQARFHALLQVHVLSYWHPGVTGLETCGPPLAEWQIVEIDCEDDENTSEENDSNDTMPPIGMLNDSDDSVNAANMSNVPLEDAPGPVLRFRLLQCPEEHLVSPERVLLRVAGAALASKLERFDASMGPRATAAAFAILASSASLATAAPPTCIHRESASGGVRRTWTVSKGPASGRHSIVVLVLVLVLLVLLVLLLQLLLLLLLHACLDVGTALNFHPMVQAPSIRQLAGWEGSNCGCSVDMSPTDSCGGKGFCADDGSCLCDIRNTGAECAESTAYELAELQCPYCSNTGICVEDRGSRCTIVIFSCRLDPPSAWSATSGARAAIPELTSAAKGEQEMAYACFFPAPETQSPSCTTFCSSPVTCSGHGMCNVFGICECDEGWAGVNCDRCADNWYPLGSCNVYCTFEETCSYHGRCNSDGICLCDDGWMTGTRSRYQYLEDMLSLDDLFPQGAPGIFQCNSTDGDVDW
eukprot:s1391_g1.t1